MANEEILDINKSAIINNYNSNSIGQFESPIAAIRALPTMYIGYEGFDGELHCVKEIVQNTLDEANIANALCNDVYISYDMSTGIYVVEDNGRGMPPDRIEQILTQPHTGGKFDKAASGYKDSAGVNGIGSTAVNAISEMFNIHVYRAENIEYSVRFEKGEVKQPLKKKKINSLKHGTRIEFRIDKTVMGEYEFEAHKLIDMIHKLSVISPLGMTINLHIIKGTKDGDIHKKFKNKNGIIDYVPHLTQKPLIKPFYGRFSDDEHMCEFVFTYDPSVTEPNVVSFANYCITNEGGTHVKGFDDGLSRFLLAAIKNGLSDKDKKANINPGVVDIRTGLVAIVNISHSSPRFEGQTKEKIINTDLIQFVSNGIRDCLVEWKRSNVADYQKIDKYVKDVVRMRLRMANEKTALLKNNAGSDTIFNSDMPTKFRRAIGGSPEINELYLIEGDSAGGLVAKARDVEFQAILPFRGYPLNTFNASITNIMKNVEIRGLVKVLGTNIGPSFDYSKLKYAKIITLSDADVDGHKIFSLICAFMLFHMRPLVEAGHFYKAMPPLYKFKYNRADKFVSSKAEYIAFLESSITKENKIATLDGTMLSKNEFIKLLEKNRPYTEMINRAAAKYAVNPTLLEFIFEMSELSVIKKNLKKKFRFMSIEEVSSGLYLSGIIDKESQGILVNETLFKALKAITNFIHTINNGNIHYLLNGEEIGLYDMLLHFKSYEPSNITRYKGIGEMNADELWNTTMDPAQRTLIRLTINDLEKELAQFDVLHGSDAQQRRQMMEMFQINPEDIDS